MTALDKYQRLQCDGLWRAAPDAQRRDVTVSFGNASLVICDTRSATPLAHWSLPAVQRRNPGQTPALFSPDPDAGETLEIEDRDMIGALETVARALGSGRRARPRLRLALGLGLAAAVLALAVFWLPGALAAHAVRVLPQPKQAEIGAILLAELGREGLPTCGAPLGLRALGRLQERLGGAARLTVLGGAAPPVLALPGGIVALGAPMLEAHDSAEVAAGHVLAAVAAAGADDPLLAALRAAGPRAVFLLLTTGDLPPRALRAHAAALATAPPAPDPDPEAVLQRFAAAGVPSTPYARALDPSGERTLALIEADPMRGGPARPVLSDSDWVSLQGICSD